MHKIAHAPTKKYQTFYAVDSESDPNRTYTVTQAYDGHWECACPAWTRHMPRKNCKHIARLLAFLSSIKERAAQIEIAILPPTPAQAMQIEKMCRASMIEV